MALRISLLIYPTNYLIFNIFLYQISFKTVYSWVKPPCRYYTIINNSTAGSCI